MSRKQTVEKIYEFWFGTKDINVLRSPNHPINFKTWFSSSEELDNKIKSEFETTLQEASSSQEPGSLYDDLLKTPSGKLALIILFDQFPRNMYRGSGNMFKYDSLALNISKDIVNQKLDRSYSFQERMFINLAFEHSENVEDVQMSVDKAREIAEDAKDTPMAKMYTSAIQYAIDHFEIVRQFNRYPHRNQLLGRISTDAELEYLRTTTSDFIKSVQKHSTTTKTTDN